MRIDYKKKMALISLIAIFFVAIDRLLKVIALNSTNWQINLISDIFKFNLEKNYNIAFSLPLSGLFLNILIGLIILLLAFIFFKLLKKRDAVNSGLLMSVIIGASSNLFDRLKYGYVVDYFDLKYFTVFNIADVMITSSIMLILLYLKKPR